MDNPNRRRLHNPEDYQLDQEVLVHAMGSLYRGRIIKRTGVTVTAVYVSGAGVKREVTCNPRRLFRGCLRGGGTYVGPRIASVTDGPEEDS